MIHGYGVGAKYDIILKGRSIELELQAPPGAVKEQIDDEVLEFRDMVRQMDHTGFNELYELYYSFLDDFKLLPSQNRTKRVRGSK